MYKKIDRKLYKGVNFHIKLEKNVTKNENFI